jgi:hypothetical protein
MGSLEEQVKEEQRVFDDERCVPLQLLCKSHRQFWLYKYAQFKNAKAQSR